VQPIDQTAPDRIIYLNGGNSRNSTWTRGPHDAPGILEDTAALAPFSLGWARINRLTLALLGRI
jgi:hypothetical protein